MTYRIDLLNTDELSEKAIILLNLSLEASASPFYELEDYLEAVRRKQSLLFGLFNNNQLEAVFFIEIKAGKGKKILILSLFGWEGMESMRNFRQFLVDFLFDIAKQNQCTDFTMLGPLAWKRIFPELILSGCVYTRRLI